MKKTFSLLLTIAMLFSLCACGNNTNTPSTSAPATSETTTEATSETAVPETTPEATPEESATVVSIGDSIDLDYASLTLNAFELSEGYEFEYRDTSSSITTTHIASIDCPSDMKLICLKGKFINKTKSEVYCSNDPVYGKLIVNGFEYETTMECYIAEKAERTLGVAAMREVDCFLYAEVPNSIADSVESCTLYIGFMKDLGFAAFADDLGDYDELFKLEALPTKA